MEEDLTNCPYCSARINLTDPCCTRCGAPNKQEPEPWLKAMGTRVKAAFSAKTEHVWADRMASFMPLHFLVSLVPLWVALNSPTGFFGILASAAALISILVFYPGWYKSAPETRKDYGIVHIVIAIIQFIVMYKTL